MPYTQGGFEPPSTETPRTIRQPNEEQQPRVPSPCLISVVRNLGEGNQPMASEGSVTRWIDQLQAGDLAAAQPLWERYFQLLVELARRKLLGAKAHSADFPICKTATISGNCWLS